MAHSDFSWRKILSFIGAAILLFVVFVAISAGIDLIVSGIIFKGVITCISGISTMILDVILYNNYIKWSDKNNTPNKIGLKN